MLSSHKTPTREEVPSHVETLHTSMNTGKSVFFLVYRALLQTATSPLRNVSCYMKKVRGASVLGLPLYIC